jgi:zinc-ribbon domain
VSYDPGPRERPPQQLCPKCRQPVAPGARFCANCGTAIGPNHSNIWPIVLAAVVALLVGAAIAFAIGGTGGSTKTVTQKGNGRVVTKQGTNTVTVETRTETHTQTQTQTTTAPTQTQTVTNTVTVTTPTTATTG